MLNNIIKFSLNNPYFILLCSLTLLVFGIHTACRMDVDVFPDLTAPTVVVMTDAHGMASEETERLVTFPIETAVNGATGVRRVRSASAQGYSFVWVEFDWGTDIFKARQIVSEKLMSISSQMPLGIEQPVLAPQSSVMGEIFFIGMRSDTTSMMDLRTLAEWNVKPLILSTRGVSQVTVIGGDLKQYQVQADPVKMKHHNVSMQELVKACKDISKNSTGGIIRQYGNEYVVRGIARTHDVEELENTFIKTSHSRPVKIRDVSKINIAGAPKMGVASLNGKPGVIISVSKQPNANTLEVTKRIEENLNILKKSLPPDVHLDTKIFRQADFIETSIRNVQQALWEGALFVILVLFIFLGSFRTTLISLTAIPISLLSAILVMKMLGITINTMSLGGMAIAIGSLVDDAIIDVENVYKRLRHNRQKPLDKKESAFKVVFDASREIRASILNATIIIMVAFIPLFFLSGMEGRMLKPLGISFIVSLFMSLVVAMTLTPLLCKIMLSGDNYLAKNENEKWLISKLTYKYENLLRWSLSHKKFILLPTLGLLIIAIILFSGFGRSFLPEFNEGSLTLSIITKPGTSLEESNQLGNLVENELLKIPEVKSTARRTGRGELDEHSQTTNSAEIDVNFQSGDRSSKEFMADVRKTLSMIPGIAFTVGQPLGHRIDHMLSGTRANIAIKLFGADLHKMFAIGNEIKSAIIDIPGLVDVNTEQQIEIPQIQIRANRELMAQYGISMEEFHEFIAVNLGGEKISEILEGQRSFDLVLKLNSPSIPGIEGLKTSLIDCEDGNKIPLEQVAEIVSTTGPSSISRENVHRKLVISANIANRDLRSTVEEIQKVISNKIQLPEGYRIEYGGQFESEARASQTLLLTSTVSILIILLLLFQEFKNLRLAGIILLNLPLALIGGVWAISISSGILSIPAIIGFITLFGIATRNGILLISNYQKLLRNGCSLSETIIKGSSDRLNAILMTALTAALALIPLALQGDKSGNEIQSPMAQVILGGLITSTLLNMFIVPIMFSFLNNRGIIKIKES